MEILVAKGENAEKNGRHREYWSRRPFSGWGWSKWVKVMTHRQERRVLAKRETQDALEKNL